MAQFARPDSVVTSNIYWVIDPYWPYIDEVTPSDGDLIECSKNRNRTIEVGLSDVVDPISSTGHTFRFRTCQQNNTKQRTLAVDLVQGTTVKATYAAFDLVRGTFTTYELTLSEAQADSISDYTDLRLRFTSGGDVDTPTGAQSAVYVSWAELEVPTPVDFGPRVTQHSVEIAHTLPEDIFVAQHIVEVAWQPLSIFSVAAHVIEVAHTRVGGRVYTVGHI